MACSRENITFPLTLHMQHAIHLGFLENKNTSDMLQFAILANRKMDENINLNF
jgi:hypothetical protein